MKQLGAIDASLLYADSPVNTNQAAIMSLLDISDVPDFSFPIFARHIIRRANLLPVLQRTVRRVPLGVDSPFWCDSGDFQLADHVRAIALEEPGDEEALDRAIGLVLSQPFNPRIPSVEAIVFEGFSDGRLPVIIRAHHSLMDGTALMNIMHAILDTDRQVTVEPGVIPLGETDTVELPDETPGWRLFTRGIRTFGGRLGLAFGLIMQLHQAARQEQGSTRDVRHNTGLSKAPRTRFTGAMTIERNFTRVNLPLSGIAEIRKSARRVTPSDIVMTIIGGAMMKLLASVGESPDRSLMAMTPRTFRTDVNNAFDNQYELSLNSLATDISDPVVRLHAIHAVSVEKARSSRQARISPDRWLYVLPPGVAGWLSYHYQRLNLQRFHAPIANLFVSNVLGPPRALYFRGATVDELQCVGPIFPGFGIGMTNAYYNGKVGIGIVSCPAIIDNLQPLRQAIMESYEELLTAVRLDAGNQT